MVANSLQSLLDKFPYFLNKNEGSNFYKVQWVNNESLKLLYNDLFQVYESFHLNKRLLVWKEQSEKYNYNVCFVAKYPNLKRVSITKNDDLIYMKEYTLEEAVNEFEFTYTCNYVKENIPQVKVFKCNDCEEIYFSNDNLTTCTTCQTETLHQTNIYQCLDCEEIYFSDNIPEECSQCSHHNFIEINAYKCNVCGQVYLGEHPPDKCNGCGTIGEIGINNLTAYSGEDITIHDNAMSFPETEATTPIEEVIPATSISEDIITDYDYDETFEDAALNTEGEVAYDEQLRLPIPIIPSDRFLIKVETYDEYTLLKGYPEYDITYENFKNAINDDRPEHYYLHSITDDSEIVEEYNAYFHDYSLDEFGALNSIPRKEYIDVANPDLYGLTEPPYNNNLTEDDYHYMKRILEYNLRLWDTPAPVLEIWKLYGLDAVMLNRERLLIKMFDENKHPFNEETGLVECWYPEEWEHKDRFCDGSASLGEYFFVELDTIRPVTWQNVIFTIKILNSLAEEITDDYTVDIYHYLEEDGVETKRELKKGHTNKTGIISYKVFDQEKVNVLRFEAFKSNGEELGVEEILLTVRNCDDGDWYVSADGSDETGDGSIDNPFQTLPKALSVVNNALDLIVIKGDLEFDNKDSIPVINSNCTIMGCDDATITSNYQRQFFHLVGERNITVHLINLVLRNDEIVTSVKSREYWNNNPNFYDYETVIIHGGATILEASINNTHYYPYDYIHLTGVLKTKEDILLKNKTLTVYLNDDEILELTTDNNGEFDTWIKIDTEYSSDDLKLSVKFDTTNYFENTQELIFHHNQVETVRVRYGQSLTLTSDSNNPVTFYYKDDNVIDTVTPDEGVATLEWTPGWGSYTVYTYKNNIGESIKDEWLIETYLTINDLDTKTFVSDISFEDNGDFRLTKKTITKLGDLNNLLTDIKFGDDLKYDKVYSNLNREDYTDEEWEGSDLTPKEFEILNQLITGIRVDEYGDLIIIRDNGE